MSIIREEYTLSFKKILLAWSIAGFCSSALGNTGQNLGFKLGIGRGGLILGGEYEVVDTSLESFIGFVSIHSKDSEKGAPGLLSFGGAFKLRFIQGPYEVYVSPGLGVINYDSGSDDDMLMGPRLSLGVNAKLDQYMALGFENEKLYSWIGEVEGPISDAFLLTFQYVM